MTGLPIYSSRFCFIQSIPDGYFPPDFPGFLLGTRYTICINVTSISKTKQQSIHEKQLASVKTTSANKSLGCAKMYFP